MKYKNIKSYDNGYRTISEILNKHGLKGNHAVVATNLLKGKLSLFRHIAMSYFGIDAQIALEGFNKLQDHVALDEAFQDILVSLVANMTDEEFAELIGPLP